jgi:hypothetical protein
MTPFRPNVITSYLLIGLMLITTSIWAQRKLDLHAIKFTENPGALLKGIPYIKSTEDKTTKYDVKQKVCSYQGILMEGSVTIDACDHRVISYQAVSNLTATTNRVLKAVLATYQQPTKKLATNANVRAWYWQTPTLFIQLMTTDVGFHDQRGQQVACTLRITNLKALKSEAEPGLLEIYKTFLSYKV